MSAGRSPQLVPVTPQGGVGSRCWPTRVIVRCDRNEARAGIVAIMSRFLERLSDGGLGTPDDIAVASPARTQLSICRGAAPAKPP